MVFLHSITESAQKPTVWESHSISNETKWEIPPSQIQEQVHQEISKIRIEDSQEPNIACRMEKRKYNEFKNKNFKGNGNKRHNTNLFCDHCKINGHTYEMCWKVHGYPPNFRQNSWRKDESKANAAQGYPYPSIDAVMNQENNYVNTKLTVEQFNQLMSLLSKQVNETKEVACSNVVQSTGTCCFSIINHNTWIIDRHRTTCVITFHCFIIAKH